MKKKALATGLSLCLMLGQTPVFAANVADDMDGFFNDVGFASNTTNVQAFQSQAAGFYGGGSLYARTPVRNYRLVTLDLPEARTGCAGIDLLTGSMSIISGDKIVEFGKQVMASSGAYAADIMIATTIPELKNVRDRLEAIAQKVNQTSINSCEMAQNLVGGLWPKTAASQDKICSDQKRMGKEGMLNDYVAARMDCAGVGRKEGMEQASQNERYKKQVVLDKNLVWSLLGDAGVVVNSQELAELMMSLTGSIIIDKEGKVTQVPSLLEGGGLIQKLLGTPGADAKIWGCDSKDKCLSVDLKGIVITEEQSLTGKVRKLIQEIDQKLRVDGAPTPQEISFLAMTPLPIMKFLTVLNSTQYGATSADIEAYASLIATDILQNYLRNLLQVVSIETHGSNLPEDIMDDLRKRIEVAMTQVSRLEPDVERKFTQKLELIENVARVEKQLASGLGAIS
jgi:conjugative transfer pilus assembly protein TraH